MDDVENQGEITKDSKAKKEEIKKRGYKLIFERADNWEYYIDNVATIKEATAIVEILEALNETKSVELVKEMFEKMNLGEVARWTVRDIVLLCSYRGPEFWKATRRGHESLKNWINVFRIERENKKFKKQHQNELPPASAENDENQTVESQASLGDIKNIISDDEIQIVIIPSSSSMIESSPVGKGLQEAETDELDR